jgi:ABC-type multidrug transport system fused ATPase/permease subunit
MHMLSVLIKSKKDLILYLTFLLIEIVISSLVVISLIPLTDFFINGSLESTNKVTFFLLEVYKKYYIHINLLSVALPFIILNIIKSLVEIVNRKIVLNLKYKAIAGIYNDLLYALFFSSLKNFRRYSHGHYMNILNKEVSNVGDAIGHFGVTVGNFIQILVYLILPFSIDFYLALIILLCLAFVSFPFIYIQKFSLKTGKMNVITANAFISFLSERFSGFKLIVSNNLQDKVINEFKILLMKHSTVAIKSQILNSAIPKLFTPLGICILIFSIYVKGESVSIPSLAAILWSFMSILPMLSSLLQTNLHIKNLIPSYNCIYEIVHNSHLNRDKFGILKDFSFSDKIEFVNVDYHYNSEKSIFSNFSCKILSGEVTVIYGDSGVGKSTLVDMVLGINRINNGDIFLDGISIYDLDLGSYKNLFGYLSQDIFLFNSSVIDNLYLYNPNISKLELNEILIKSGLLKVIQQLPNGIDTLIGENGNSLSGGQRQKLALAMVLTKSPKILILDEPTSALDEESESEFWDLISELIPDYTIIVVTHKLKYLREYFNIIKLSKDNFFESGKWIKYKKLI